MAAFNTTEEAKETAEELNKFGKLAKEYGITIGYHNHTGEFYQDNGVYLGATEPRADGMAAVW